MYQWTYNDNSLIKDSLIGKVMVGVGVCCTLVLVGEEKNFLHCGNKDFF